MALKRSVGPTRVIVKVGRIISGNYTAQGGRNWMLITDKGQFLVGTNSMAGYEMGNIRPGDTLELVCDGHRTFSDFTKIGPNPTERSNKK